MKFTFFSQSESIETHAFFAQKDFFTWWILFLRFFSYSGWGYSSTTHSSSSSSISISTSAVVVVLFPIWFA